MKKISYWVQLSFEFFKKDTGETWPPQIQKNDANQDYGFQSQKIQSESQRPKGMFATLT